MVLSVLGNFLMAVGKVLEYALNMYKLIVIASVILSWVNPAPHNSVVRSIIYFINSVTEPVFYQIRKRIPVNFGGLDFSPIIVFIAIVFLEVFLVNSLYDMAVRL